MDKMAFSIDFFPISMFLTRNANITDVKTNITEFDSVPENPNMLAIKFLDRIREKKVNPISIRVGLSSFDFQIAISSLAFRLNVHVVVPINVRTTKITLLLNSKKSDVNGRKKIGTRNSIR